MKFQIGESVQVSGYYADTRPEFFARRILQKATIVGYVNGLYAIDLDFETDNDGTERYIARWLPEYLVPIHSCHCKFCDEYNRKSYDGPTFTEESTDYKITQRMVTNKDKETFLEVSVSDYQEFLYKIQYCPFCGRKL